MAETIYWYDFETTGTDPIADRAIQFAGVRTDLDLNPVSEPLNLLCMPGEDCVPDPEAILVTGITLSSLQKNGLTEAEFCRRIHDEFATPQTCVTGFNSIRFDDEFMRQTLYRNFFEPYAREWQGGNSRWDVIDLMRTAYALRPEGVNWVEDDGVPSFRLERLTDANGIAHADAHDAVADVNATIAMAHVIKKAQPRLFDYLFTLRQKKEVLKLLYPLKKTPLIHISSMYPATRGCAAMVLPLCSHPTNNNGVLCYDLSQSPDRLIESSPDEIRRLVFSRQSDLGNEARIALSTVYVNRCPSLAVVKTLSDKRAADLEIDVAQCLANATLLQRTAGLVERIEEAFSVRPDSQQDDPDYLLYGGGFLSGSDISLMAEVRAAAPAELKRFAGQFQDDRMNDILLRYRGRNYPDTLDVAERRVWGRFLIERTLPRLEASLAKTQALDTQQREMPAIVDLNRYLMAQRANIVGKN